MKVYTIFTGGTIGSRKDENGWITAKGSSPYTLLELYCRQYVSNIEFVVEEPYCILSENLAAENIRKLIQCVKGAVEKQDIDGIVITHGTDTLQYSAAILGYLFHNVQIPILLVSSDYTLDDKRSNGLGNFRYALEFIRGGYGRGVFVSYCNKGAIPMIHRGTRLLQHLPFSADIASVGNSWYGKFENGKFVKNPEYRIREGLSAMFENIGEVKLNDCTDEIIRIVPYVGMSYPVISKNTKVVLHESFHSGTIAVSQGLKEFADRAATLNIPVYLSGLSEKETEYETVSHYRAIGITPLCQSAPIAQYCKLWLALSNGVEMEKIMKISVAEDFF